MLKGPKRSFVVLVLGIKFKQRYKHNVREQNLFQSKQKMLLMEQEMFREQNLFQIEQKMLEGGQNMFADENCSKLNRKW